MRHIFWTLLITTGDLKSGDCLFCSTVPSNINHSLPSHKHNPTRSPNYDISVAQDIIRSLTWKIDRQNFLSDKAVLSVMIYVQRCHRNRTLIKMKCYILGKNGLSSKLKQRRTQSSVLTGRILIIMTRTGEREICAVSGRFPDIPRELA